jgi:hypothetical protein
VPRHADITKVPDQAHLGVGTSETVAFGTGAPYLSVIIDAEEEFDWTSAPYTSKGVASMRCQQIAQRIFERYGVVPTYAVDYAVAAQADGYEPLLDYLRDGKCEIGAQLHPWVNPPVDEDLTLANSFPGNLPPALEFEKLRRLTATIEDNFGCHPILYRAGRYGAGANTAAILDRLGYRIDCSVVPFHDYRPRFGPDFRQAPNEPYWFGPGNRLLELPVTVGMIGRLARGAHHFPSLMDASVSHTLRLPAILARAGLLDRVRLTPEGVSLDEAKRLTRTLLRRDGHRVFVISYHSPSLEAGHTPYVRTAAELRHFTDWLEGYLDFFFGELGGMAATPACILAEAEFA